MKKEKLEKAMMHCYRQLFAYSTPSVSFDDLVENAKVNDRGQKEIPFMDYEISQKHADEIIEQTIKDFKIKPKYYAHGFKTSIYLGCSPKFKRDEQDGAA